MRLYSNEPVRSTTQAYASRSLTCSTVHIDLPLHPSLLILVPPSAHSIVTAIASSLLIVSISTIFGIAYGTAHPAPNRPWALGGRLRASLTSPLSLDSAAARIRNSRVAHDLALFLLALQSCFQASYHQGKSLSLLSISRRLRTSRTMAAGFVWERTRKVEEDAAEPFVVVEV